MKKLQYKKSKNFARAAEILCVDRICLTPSFCSLVGFRLSEQEQELTGPAKKVEKDARRDARRRERPPATNRRVAFGTRIGSCAGIDRPRVVNGDASRDRDRGGGGYYPFCARLPVLRAKGQHKNLWMQCNAADETRAGRGEEEDNRQWRRRTDGCTDGYGSSLERGSAIALLN